jgi:hypothetical protein
MPAALLLLALPVAAQVKLGEVSSNMGGTIAVGYTADYGNQTSSDHNWTLGGNANLSGSFYSPNFLSYNASVYLNQSKANSNYQSTSDASGVDISTTIFGGSKFPGSISYSKAYDSEGNYAVPGLANYVTHGNSDTFGVNWSENLPNAPSFSAGFVVGDSKYSVYGSTDEGLNKFHSLNLHSGYSLGGFNMGAYYTTGGGNSLSPQLGTDEPSEQTQNGTTVYGLNVSHQLPLRGTASAALNRSTWTSDFLGSNSTGTVDLINADASVHPTSKLALSGSVSYSDNLSGQLAESVVAAGGVVQGLNTNESSDSVDLMAVASYAPLPNVATTAFVERRTQLYLGQQYGVQSYGGSATYSHPLFEGMFNAMLSAMANDSGQNGEDTLGFSTSENYSNVVLGWNVNGSFSYSQNQQTLLVTYLNSIYSFSGSARRRWGKLSVSGSGGGSRTGLTEQAGTVSTSENYSGSVGYGAWLTANGGYFRSSGQALSTGSGLVPVPVPSPVLPSNLVSLYGGDGYSLSFSSTPVRHLVLSASYAKSISNTSSSGVSSSNLNNQFNVFAQSQFRKLYFNSGYSRLEQGFSGSGTPPGVVSSFYIGVSRWFNFF